MHVELRVIQTSSYDELCQQAVEKLAPFADLCVEDVMVASPGIARDGSGEIGRFTATVVVRPVDETIAVLVMRPDGTSVTHQYILPQL
jgi:hypothetical protein